MNLDTMLFCRVLWQDKYEGIENKPSQNLREKFVEEHDFGHECWNFRPHQNTLYGFFQHWNPSTIIERLAENAGLENPKTRKKIAGAPVVWVGGKMQRFTTNRQPDQMQRR